jgi:hypothetical protein
MRFYSATVAVQISLSLGSIRQLEFCTAMSGSTSGSSVLLNGGMSKPSTGQRYVPA